MSSGDQPVNGRPSTRPIGRTLADCAVQVVIAVLAIQFLLPALLTLAAR
jgi:hypothetical protein